MMKGYLLLSCLSASQAFISPALPGLSQRSLPCMTMATGGPVSRRTCLELPLTAGAALLLGAMPGHADEPTWKPDGPKNNAESWYPLVKKGYEALNRLLDNWDAIEPKGGDEFRRYLGTVGVSSPLSGIRRAFVAIKDADEMPDSLDIVEFAEAYEEVLQDLRDAENDFYSSIFADSSGGGNLKGSQFVLKAKDRVKAAKKSYEKVLKILEIPK
ncbi:unnamed protein product [Chrysoparadoxa australica]